jgi:hypothetical protein
MVDFRIRLKGILDAEWADWFEGVAVHTTDEGVTVLVGTLPDQAAAHGLLNQIRDLRIPFASVEMHECPDR